MLELVRNVPSSSDPIDCRMVAHDLWPRRLLERRDVVIVATVSAIYGIGDPSDYHQMILHLKEREKAPQREIIARLVNMQYERNDIEFKRGVFRVRGDVIDIFPAENSETALRVSMFDDEVEQLSMPLGPIKRKVAWKLPPMKLLSRSEQQQVNRAAVEERGRHLCVAEDAGPFSECEVCRDDDRGALIETADQVEQ